MDSYKHKKCLRQLSKKRDNHLKIVETSVKNVNDEATIIEVVIDELSIPSDSKTVYTLKLCKQIIKVLAVVLVFLLVIFSTISN